MTIGNSEAKKRERSLPETQRSRELGRVPERVGASPRNRPHYQPRICRSKVSNWK